MTFVQVQVPSSAWVAQGTYMYYADVSVPSVTQAIVDSGMVMVNFQESPFGWTPLPYNEIIAFNSYTFTNLNFYYTPGEVQFRIEGNVGGPANPGTMNFKVFTLAASGRLPDPSVLGLE